MEEERWKLVGWRQLKCGGDDFSEGGKALDWELELRATPDVAVHLSSATGSRCVTPRRRSATQCWQVGGVNVCLCE